MTRIRLDQFDAGKGLDRGRSRAVEAIWYLIKCIFFLSPLPWPPKLRCWLLKRFGAEIGRSVVIKPRVNIHFPWKLKIGDHSWIGEEAFLLNFEPITIGSHCCISQRVFLCTGNHDFRIPSFDYRNAPITVADGAWIGACVFVAPGVLVNREAVITAGSIVTQSIPEAMIASGNPCVPLRARWKDQTQDIS